jgi:hypothetical protein
VGFGVAENFHVYGIDWSEESIDGKLLAEVTAAQVTEWAKKNLKVDEGYVATVPINLWLDQEIFPWVGIPKSKEDLERNSQEGKKDDGVVIASWLLYPNQYWRTWIQFLVFLFVFLPLLMGGFIYWILNCDQTDWLNGGG